MSITTAIDRDWDMSVVWPSLDSAEFDAAFDASLDSLAQLSALFDEHGIGDGPPLGDESATLDNILERINDTFEAMDVVHGYLFCFTAVDSRNDLAKARLNEFENRAVRRAKLRSRFEQWIGRIDLGATLAHSSSGQDHAFFLNRAATLAKHQMSAAEEDLAADLTMSGASPWATLREDVASQITVEFDLDGVVKPLSMSELRNLAQDDRGVVRKRAYDAEIAAWERHALPIAAALNGIKGEGGTLTARRGWSSPVALAAFQNNIDEATLDAMMSAGRDSFPAFRRYFQAKARLLGAQQLAWWELSAPVGDPGRTWDYDDACEFVAANFDAFSVRMGDHARRAVRERWIDVDPKPGKMGGAWCMPLRNDEARVLLNFSPSFDGVNTLAHELGHAYHDLNLSIRTALQRQTPSTLAETASTFCETIILHAATANASPMEELAILDGSLHSRAMTVVDISSRFLFEKHVFEKRRARELSIDEFSAAMLDAQRATYGDGVDPNTYHKYMWAAKPHYYDVDENFYNFPYMFGLLFGLGLYARFIDDPVAFRVNYDDLLSMTGMADAATLAARFGIDLRGREFWDASLAIVAKDIDRFVELAEMATSKN